MHQLEEESDRLMDSFLEAGALADKNITNSEKETESQQQPASFQLSLRPSFEIEDHRDAFILTAATPGLNKEHISVDVVEGTDGAAYLIVSGHSSWGNI
jgi:HSP20 family molecular chaperone IbpA